MALEEKLKRAAQLKSELIALEKEVETETKSEMLALPAKFGFTSMVDFIRVLGDVSGTKAFKKFVRIKGEMKVRVIEAFKNARTITADVARKENIDQASLERFRQKMEKKRVIPKRP